MNQAGMAGTVVLLAGLLAGSAWAGEMKGMGKMPGHDMKSMSAQAVTTAAKAADQDEMVVCPVLKTKIKKSQASGSAVYEGKTYYFCCAGCKPEFLKNPKKYLAPAKESKVSKEQAGE